jgi:hypothetical protein
MTAPEILATLVEPAGGKFCTFEAGEVVKVYWDDGITCDIERRPWAGSLVTLTNCLAGVPRHKLRFHAEKIQPPTCVCGAVMYRHGGLWQCGEEHCRSYTPVHG